MFASMQRHRQQSSIGMTTCNAVAVAVAAMEAKPQRYIQRLMQATFEMMQVATNFV